MSNKLRSIKRKTEKAVEKLSPEVLQMLRNSAGQLEAAQTAHNALVSQVVGLYQLKQTDSVDLATGEITRSE